MQNGEDIITMHTYSGGEMNVRRIAMRTGEIIIFNYCVRCEQQETSVRITVNILREI